MKFYLFVLFFLVIVLTQCQIPPNFDARQKWPKCTLAIRNQGRCGSCWAFSTTTGFSERYCIHGGSGNPAVSPQYVINCNTVGQSGCEGGVTTTAYEYLRTNGACTDQCTKYYSGDTGKTGKCPTACDNGSALKKYFNSRTYALKARDIAAMQTDIMNNGPISASYVVYEDFVPFFQKTPKGVYKHVSGAARGGHAIVIVGWGVQDNTPFWLCHNSWGTTFGDGGYFRIIRGTDDSTIESRRLAAGIPKTNFVIPSYAVPPQPNNERDNAIMDVEVDEEIEKVALEAMLKIYSVNSNLPLMSKVLKARTQVVAGIKYFLKIQFENESIGSIVAVRNPLNELEVTHFSF